MLDEVAYEFDLSSQHAGEFGAALAKYIGAVRRTGGRRAGRRRSPSTTASGRASGSSGVRAVAQGLRTSGRRRILADVRAMYDAEH